MAAKTQNHSPFSRISRLIRSGPSSPLAREPDVEPPTQEDWYIPYNGPYEPPRGMPESVVERDSWGNLVSGWLAEDPQATKREDRYARTSRDRAKSDAATLASSSAPTPRHRSFSTRNTPRPSVNSIIHAGGVGEAPVPVREPQEAQPKPETTRHSLASILSLGTRRGLTIRHSSSAGQLTRQASGSTDHHAPPPTENAPESMVLRRHPYAFPYSTTATAPSPPRAPSPHARRPPPSKIKVAPQRPSRTLPPPPPAFLQPTPRNRLTIRGSISTPNLRNPQTTSQPRSPAPPTPKGKQRWLSPETWCDALILPRPRFAIRVDPGGGSGRIVSPPDSPVQPNTITYYQSRAEKEPTTGSSHGLDRADSHEPLLAAQNTRPRASTVEPIAGPSRVTVEEQRQAVGVGRSSGDRHGVGISMPPSSFKPPRPKSFALDDLALPSPAPSLMKYVTVALLFVIYPSINRVVRAPLMASMVSFAQANHPYASASPAWAIEEAPQASMQPAVTVDPPTDEGGQMIEVQADTTSSMFAEITPGHIREFQPEQLRYSPFIMVHPVEQKADGLSSGARSHPYVAQSRRMSEWGFADALTETLRDRGSVDSGLGTSESLDHLRNTDRSGQRADTRPMPADLPPVPLEDPSERLRPGMRRREATRSSSNHTLASSPMDSVNPPSFRAQPTEERLTTNGQSSGSSPGMISHDSSPPLSPRSFNASDDLERFRDLFYQPPPRPETPEEARLDTFSPPTPSRQPSSGVSTRSVSGLTTLARQLADDIDELRQISRDSMDDSEASPMWGRRFGGLRGQRPEEASPNPNVVLSGPTSDRSTPFEASSPPLRFPIDRTASLAQPTINVPEDVEESSRASSIIQYASYEESDTGHMRVGSIEALSTPAALSSPQRSSTMLSFVNLPRGNEERSSQNVAVPRIDSTYSSLGAPVSDAARSSYMTSGTGMSRMSGLSDFPVPPTDVTPEQLSVLNSYFDDSQSSQQFNGFLSPPRPGGLVREPSTNTFGGQNEIGQAL